MSSVWEHPSQSTPVVECESLKDVCRKLGVYGGIGVELCGCVWEGVWGKGEGVCVSVVRGEGE